MCAHSHHDYYYYYLIGSSTTSRIHRDLKYENILFASNTPNAEIKLIDFGLSKRFVEQDEMTEGAGTVYTMAPEVLAGCYTKQADLWSVGVIAYMLMSSMMPFFGQTRMEVMKKVVKGYVCGCNFIACLFVVDIYLCA